MTVFASESTTSIRLISQARLYGWYPRLDSTVFPTASECVPTHHDSVGLSEVPGVVGELSDLLVEAGGGRDVREGDPLHFFTGNLGGGRSCDIGGGGGGGGGHMKVTPYHSCGKSCRQREHLTVK